MNTCNAIVIALSACFLLEIGGVTVQHNQIATLRKKQQQIQNEIAKVRVESSDSALGPQAETSDTPARPPLELLKLRNLITELTRRRNELTNAESENQHLRAELEARRTNNAATRFRVPPGYIRRSEARWMGTSTPKNTMESFFWAVQHRDFQRLIEVLSKDDVTNLRNEHDAAEHAFESYSRFPGMRVVGEQKISDDEVRLRLDFLPGMMPPQSITFHRVNGQWKLMHFF